MQSRLAKLMLSVAWYWVARPLNDTVALYFSCQLRGKVAVVLASPLLFIWFAAFQAPEVSPYASLHDLPGLPSFDLRLVAGQWVQFQRPFSFSHLAGDPCLVVNCAVNFDGADENFDDLRKVQDEMEASGQVLRILAIPCGQFLGSGQGQPVTFSDYVAGRGVGITFFEKVNVNGRDASPMFTFLKAACGDRRPIEWNFCKFLVSPDGRQVKRYGPLVMASDIVFDLFNPQLSVSSPSWHRSLDPPQPSATPSKRHMRTGAVPVVGPGQRRRKRLAAIVDSPRTISLMIACATVAIFLYPGTVAASAATGTRAIDGVLFACGLALAIESVVRWHSGVSEEYGARGAMQPLVELFCGATLGMDISFVAGAWAERQTEWKILSGIRAARVIRVIRLWYLVQSWRRRTTHPHDIQRRFPTAQSLARKALDSSTMQAGALMIIGAVIAAPFLTFNRGQDQVTTAVSAVENALDGVNGTSIEILAAVFCDRGVASGVQPLSVTVGGTAIARCAVPKTVPSRRHVVSFVIQGVTLTFDILGQQREEALATIYLILFVIGGIVLLSLTLSESVDRQVVRPLETVWSMLTLKSAEAYSALRHLGAFSGADDDLTDSTERMVLQLSRMALCFKGLAAESEGYLLEQYLGPDDAIDPATRQWLLGQAGHELAKSGDNGGGLNFVAGSGYRNSSQHVGLVSAIRQSSNNASTRVRPTARGSGLLSPFAISGTSAVLRESGATNVTATMAPSRGTSRETIVHAGQSLLGFLLGKDRDDSRWATSMDESFGGASPSFLTMSAAQQQAQQQQQHFRSHPPSVGPSGDLSQTAGQLVAGGSEAHDSLSQGTGLGKLPIINQRASAGRPRMSAASLDWPEPCLVDPRAGAAVDAEPPWAGPCRAREMNDLANWSIDLFDYGPLELCRVAYAIYESLGAISFGYCSETTLWNFVVEVSNLYHQNAFHNFRHAVDVLQACYHFLKTIERRKLFTSLECFALAVAALGHDVDHPGITNAFLIATSDPLAVLYNDVAVLESHHVATLFRMFQTRPSTNVFARCDRETMKGVRKLVVEAVLSTDMARHFPMVTKAEVYAELNKDTIVQAARGDPEACARLRGSAEDRTFMMNLFLHCADISNPARPKAIQDRWAELVLKEFFDQGDRESALGLPISPGFDRKTVTLPMSQINFSEFVVMPLYVSLIAIFPELMQTAIQVQKNYEAYMEVELLAKGEAERSQLMKRRSAFDRKVSAGIVQAARVLAKPFRGDSAASGDAPVFTHPAAATSAGDAAMRNAANAALAPSRPDATASKGKLGEVQPSAPLPKGSDLETEEKVGSKQAPPTSVPSPRARMADGNAPTLNVPSPRT